MSSAVMRCSMIWIAFLSIQLIFLSLITAALPPNSLRGQPSDQSLSDLYNQQPLFSTQTTTTTTNPQQQQQQHHRSLEDLSGKEACSNCKASLGQQCVGRTIIDENCDNCSKGQAFWPCNLKKECWCWDTNLPRDPGDDDDKDRACSGCGRGGNTETCVSNQNSLVPVGDEECNKCMEGQSFWPCDDPDLCWCWDTRKPKKPPAPASGLTVAKLLDPNVPSPCDILTYDMFMILAPNSTFPYTYQGLCDAIEDYNVHHTEKFAAMGTETHIRAEIAAFLGNTAHESDDFEAGREYLACGDRKEVDGKVYCKPCNNDLYDWKLNECSVSMVDQNSPYNSYCQPGFKPPEGCVCETITQVAESGELAGYVEASKVFYGRGAIQLSWNYNYIRASYSLTGNAETFCNDPEMVATTPKYAWGSGIYFWMENQKEGSTCHKEALKGDFGGTLNNINGGLECPAYKGGWHADAIKMRLNRYCHAAHHTGMPALSTLEGCKGMMESYEECLGDGHCPYCKEYYDGVDPIFFTDELREEGSRFVSVDDGSDNGGSNVVDTGPAPAPVEVVPEEPQRPKKTVNPTEPPVSEQPTEAPVSGKPTQALVSDDPTEPPVSGQPTEAPVSGTPTEPPATEKPTEASVSASTPLPTLVFSLAMASSIPAAETPAPSTSLETNAPTLPPTPPPTEGAKTASPTTLKPTSNPTLTPTTAQPSTSPVNSPTEKPTSGEPTYIPTTPQPTMGPCDGDSCPGKMCRSAYGFCGSGPAYCSDNSIWSPECKTNSKRPTPTPTSGEPTSGPLEKATPALDGVFGVKKQPTNSPVMATEEPTTLEPTPSPTLRPTEGVEEPTEGVMWPTEGAVPTGGGAAVVFSATRSPIAFSYPKMATDEPTRKPIIPPKAAFAKPSGGKKKPGGGKPKPSASSGGKPPPASSSSGSKPKPATPTVNSKPPPPTSQPIMETAQEEEEISTPQPTPSPITDQPTPYPSPYPTPYPTWEPTTQSPTFKPTMKVYSPTDPEATYFCGVEWADANKRCKVACPSSRTEDCPNGQKCYAFTTCMDPTPDPTFNPPFTPAPATPSPITPAPTEEEPEFEGCTGMPCMFAGECRSQYGFCGTSFIYCNALSAWSLPNCGLTGKNADGEMMVCDATAKKCPEGEEMYQDPANDCDYFPCPEEEEEENVYSAAFQAPPPSPKKDEFPELPKPTLPVIEKAIPHKLPSVSKTDVIDLGKKISGNGTVVIVGTMDDVADDGSESAQSADDAEGEEEADEEEEEELEDDNTEVSAVRNEPAFGSFSPNEWLSSDAHIMSCNFNFLLAPLAITIVTIILTI